MTSRFPLSVTDELFLHLEKPEESMHLQLDIRFSGRLDEQKLEAALFSAMAAHPLASVRLRCPVSLDGSYEWEAVERPDEDPVLTVSCADDEIGRAHV